MKSPNKTVKIILLSILFLLVPLSVFAFSYYSVESQGFDTTLSEQTEDIYTHPSQIYITQVVTDSADLQRDPAKWVKALYYYSITRLHLSDLPYTYLLDEGGIIYQGAEGGVGTNPQLKEVQGAVIIGYLSKNPSLTNRASESLLNMVDEISSDWGISNLSTVKLNISQEEAQLSAITVEESTGDFSKSVESALENWEGYEEENQEYVVEIEEINYPEEIEIGERLNVKLKIKNKNDFIWFTDKDPIYISVQGGEESEFAINQEWDSFSKPASISDTSILPGESVEMEFDMAARVFLGEVETNLFLLLKE